MDASGNRKFIEMVEYADQLRINQQTTITHLVYAFSLLRKNARCVSGVIPGTIPDYGTPVSPEQVRMNTLALVSELMEMLDEWNWKSWKSPHLIDADRVAYEFADILHFLGVLLEFMSRVGLTDHEIALAFVNKVFANVERFKGKVDGYGVSTALGFGEGGTTPTSQTQAPPQGLYDGER